MRKNRGFPGSGQNHINHIALVLDASGTMEPYREAVVTVVDNEIQSLAKRSRELDQETRVTVYLFDREVICVIYDKDVLRLPSIRDFYMNWGGSTTALIDATMQSQLDLRQTPQIYGDHAFLTYVLTDGLENASHNYGPSALRSLLESQKDNETIGVLVPEQRHVDGTVRLGFHRGNVAVWDATSRRGVVEVGTRIRATTDAFMVARAHGVKGTRTLFTGGAEVVNRETVGVKHGFTALKKDVDYRIFTIRTESVIRLAVEALTGAAYRRGAAFYELVKSEVVQDYKEIRIRHRKNGMVYAGPDSRKILGLPDAGSVRVRPADNYTYQIFVQSTSVNRKLPAGTKLLVMKW